jgi:DNA polymerase III alpha subunit
MIKKYSLMPILTGDVHYAFPEDNRLQDVLISINQHKTVDDPKAFKLNARHLNYANGDDFFRMNKEFGFNYPESFINQCLDNTLKVADKCNFEFETDKENIQPMNRLLMLLNILLLKVTRSLLQNLAHAKLKQKLKTYENNGTIEITDEVRKKYTDRLDYELKVIKEKK